MTLASAVRACGNVLCAVSMTFAIGAHAAGTYPDHPITIVVPYGPGTGLDVIARILGQRIGQTMGQSIVIENRPGAVAVIGSTLVAQAKPDGYTLLINSTSGVINQLTTSTPVDLRKDLVPVALTGTMPYVLAVSSKSPAHSIKDLVDYARAHPGTLNYASNGNGLPQFLGEALTSSQKVNIVQIPYKSTTDAQTDVISGRVSIWFTTMASAIPLMRADKVRILGVTGDTAPDVLGGKVPTMKQAGFPAMDGQVRFFIFAPAGTPKPIVERLNAELGRAQHVKSVSDTLIFQGVFPHSANVQETASLLNDEFDKWGKAIKATAGSQ